MGGTRSVEVLIVGAGPTGLVLALWLRRLGVQVRIIDQSIGPGTTSRAIAVHARTLEQYQQLGIADLVVDRGLEFSSFNLWVRGERVARAELGKLGVGLSPFPYVIAFPQDQHEALLIEQLATVDVTVERETELVDLVQRADDVLVRTRRADGTVHEASAVFVAGCDGSHSRVREQLGLAFTGGTYGRMFYVADVDLRGPVDNQELHVALDDADFLAVFPMKGRHTARLIGTVSTEGQDYRELAWADVSARVFERLAVTIDRVNWFSTYRVHHRVAEHFRRGRAFLVGDAAHIHSPVGGQGLNTGIGDAANLAWKLAAVLQGRADAKVLDSYEPERIAFARRLVATTDRAFTFITRDGPIARRVRMAVAPVLLPRLAAQRAVRRFAFRTISQILVKYRDSALSAGVAGAVHGGDRLPWAGADAAAGVDNFAPLASLAWQLHVYGEASAELARCCAARGLPLHTFPWHASMTRAGLARNAAYLVRPDGYVALADSAARPEPLEHYLDAHGLRFTPPPRPDLVATVPATR